MVKLGVLISGGGTNLQAIMDACSSGDIEGRIEVVISSSQTAYGLNRARQAGIPAYVLSESEDILSLLKAKGVELVVLAGYLKKVSKEMVDAYPQRIINIHPSLIPAFSGPGFYGLKVHEAAINRGVKISGATTHFVDEDVDEGPIIDQVAVPVYEEDTAEELQARVLKEEHPLLLASIKEVIRQMKRG